MNQAAAEADALYDQVQEAMRQQQRRRVPPALAEAIYTWAGEISMQWEPTPSGIFKATRAAELADELVRAIGIKMLEHDQAIVLQLRGARYNLRRVHAFVEPTEVGNEVYRYITDALAALERLGELVPEVEEEPSNPPVGTTAERAGRVIDPMGVQNAEVP